MNTFTEETLIIILNSFNPNTPTITVSAEENLWDPIDIMVDIIYPKPVAEVSFPVAAIVRTQAQHGEAIKCNYHHDGECAPKCTNCKKVGHLTKDYWHPINANNQRTITCYECENQGHYKSDFPDLKNQNYGNKAKCTKARGMVCALGGGETNQDLNNVEDDINA
ncbi:reverse transcriptase domain-containing protein [Tanacetum coccineum]